MDRHLNSVGFKSGTSIYEVQSTYLVATKISFIVDVFSFNLSLFDFFIFLTCFIEDQLCEVCSYCF